MNRLLTTAPSVLEIDGVSYSIDTSFRTALSVFIALRDNALSNETKIDLMIRWIYWEYDNPEFNNGQYDEKMVEMAIWYLKCGDIKESKEKKQVIDFEFDSQRIVDAFNAKNINLDIVDMHWWTFMSHFAAFPECSLTRIMYLRQLYNDGKLNKKEHKAEREEAAKYGWDIIKIQSEEQVIEELEIQMMESLMR